MSLSELECILTTKGYDRTYAQLQVGYISVNSITTEGGRPASGGLTMMGGGQVEKEEVRL